MSNLFRLHHICIYNNKMQKARHSTQQDVNITQAMKIRAKNRSKSARRPPKWDELWEQARSTSLPSPSVSAWWCYSKPISNVRAVIYTVVNIHPSIHPSIHPPIQTDRPLPETHFDGPISKPELHLHGKWKHYIWTLQFLPNNAGSILQVLDRCFNLILLTSNCFSLLRSRYYSHRELNCVPFLALLKVVGYLLLAHTWQGTSSLPIALCLRIERMNSNIMNQCLLVRFVFGRWRIFAVVLFDWQISRNVWAS